MIPAALLNKSPVPYHWGQVATGCFMNWATFTGSYKQQISREAHFACDDISALQLTFNNTQAIEGAVGGTAYIEASIEYPQDVFTRYTFSGGSNSYTIADSGRVTGDVVPVVIPKGAQFWVRTWRETASTSVGLLLLASRRSSSAGEWSDYAASGLTNSVMGGSPATNRAYTYGPCAIEAWTKCRSVILLGDSRTRGQGSWSGYPWNDTGILAPLLVNARVAYINAGIGGDTMQNMAGGGATTTIRRALIPKCTDGIVAFGINDFVAGRTAAQVKADFATIAANNALAIPSGKWAITTCYQKVSTTDAYATLANQTPFAYDSQRVSFDTDVRAGNVARAHYFLDPCMYAESSFNSGKFPVTGSANGYTSDGLHLNNAGEQLVYNGKYFDPRMYL